MIKSLIIVAILSTLAMAENIYATFNVIADKEANLMLSSNGLVEKIYVDVGDHVTKGELLLELQSTDLKTSILLAEKKVELASLNLKYSQKAYERFSKIKDVIDEEKFDHYASSYERVKIELSNAKANLLYKQALYAKTRLVAPFSGVIAQKFVEEGDGISAVATKKIFQLITDKKQILKLRVDEKHWLRVQKGQTFTYKLDGSKTALHGKVSKIYPAIDAQKRAITLEVPAKNLKVGLFGHGYLEVE